MRSGSPSRNRNDRMHVLPVYAALFALLYVGLSVRTLNLRRTLRIAIGDSGNEMMLRAMRVHSKLRRVRAFQPPLDPAGRDASCTPGSGACAMSVSACRKTFPRVRGKSAKRELQVSCRRDDTDLYHASCIGRVPDPRVCTLSRRLIKGTKYWAKAKSF